MFQIYCIEQKKIQKHENIFKDLLKDNEIFIFIFFVLAVFSDSRDSTRKRPFRQKFTLSATENSTNGDS